MAEGMSAAQAAQQARLPDGAAPSPAVATPLLDARRDALLSALLAFDERAAQDAIDRLLMEFDSETVMRAVFLPVLREIGDRWERGTASVGQEHFASNLIRRRLGGLARGWDAGRGPMAVLACPPDEEHDIPLMMFGIALGHRGWRVTFLGARTPVEDLVRTVDSTSPELVALASPGSDGLREACASLRKRAPRVRVAVGGAGASAELAKTCGATLLSGDPVTAADEIAAASD
jgi:methanogenic corrinoid protein MtbC1